MIYLELLLEYESLTSLTEVPELKRWLACRGASRSGNKAAIIECVNDYIRRGSAKRLVDPDSGIHLWLLLEVRAVVGNHQNLQ